MKLSVKAYTTWLKKILHTITLSLKNNQVMKKQVGMKS